MQIGYMEILKKLWKVKTGLTSWKYSRAVHFR